MWQLNEKVFWCIFPTRNGTVEKESSYERYITVCLLNHIFSVWGNKSIDTHIFLNHNSGLLPFFATLVLRVCALAFKVEKIFPFSLAHSRSIINNSKINFLKKFSHEIFGDFIISGQNPSEFKRKKLFHIYKRKEIQETQSAYRVVQHGI